MGLFDLLTLPAQFFMDYQNRRDQNKINTLNLAHADYWNAQNIGLQRETNEANRGLVRDINAQQIALQHESWRREDDAVQRRAADLRSAGINPILAAGQGAQASGPINLNTPRDEAPQARHLARMEAYRMQTDIVERALRMRDDFATNEKSRIVMDATADEHRARADQIRRETDLLGSSSDSFGLRLRQAASTMQREGAQAALLNEQRETERLRQTNIDAQTMATLLDNVKREVDNVVSSRTMENRISQVEADLAAQVIANDIARREEEIRSSLGVTQSGGLIEKGLQFVRHQTGRFVDFALGVFAPDLERDGWRLRRK